MRLQILLAATLAQLSLALWPNALLELNVRGSPFEVGLQTGLAFKARIQALVGPDGSMAEVETYIKTQPGKDQFASMKSAAESLMPEAIEELKGLAAGAGISYEQALLINMADEFSRILHPASFIPHCSDILHADSTAFIAHNEDGGRNDRGQTYLLSASVESSEYDTVAFTVYNYPGSLSTGAFGFNEHGLIMTTNAIFAKYVDVKGLPRNFLQRYVLSSRSLDEAIKRATTTRVALGFSLNLASFREPSRAANVEIGTDLTSSVLYVNQTTGPYFHANMYRRLQLPQWTDTSSVARLARESVMTPPSTLALARNVLGDTQNQTFPIYRTGLPPDEYATLATAVFDTHEQTMTVYLNNPKTEPHTLVRHFK